ncbi:MAG TPA: helix-turn-helix domain-containing protein [Solirubrobacterales bacterium]|nr:helix-turn-helix domain-containing protein [Solirubrobacterales bacterium]
MAGRPGGATQRERLIEAMTVVAARHGYAEASVARVIKQAGMSRATFYEHFEDRDDCFRAAFRLEAQRVVEDLRASEESSRLDGRPAAVMEQMLTQAERNPEATCLLMTEAMAADPRIRAELEELLDLIELAIGRYLDAAAAQLPPIEIPTRALLGAMGNLVRTRVFRGEAGGLRDLLDDLVAWFNSYAMPRGHRRLREEDWQELGRSWRELRSEPPAETRAPRALPRGRSALPRGQVGSEHRERIIEAIATCVRAKGYEATTVADLVRGAGVSRTAFYEQFRNKEDAFLAAQALGLERSAGLVAARFFIEAPWPERVWNAAEALAGYISEHADLAYAGVVEIYAAGPAAIRRQFESRMAYTLFLEEGYRQRPEAEALPRIASEAISGATEELLRRQIAIGRTEKAQELVPAAAYVTLAPFIGAERALEFVTERSRGESG